MIVEVKSQTPSAAELIELLQLRPHPEGGYFAETYRSSGLLSAAALPAPWQGPHNYSTAIYFLLPAGAKSSLHRIASDEVWHFYLGGPMTLVELTPAGEIRQTTLGNDLSAGHKLQHVVPAGTWFGGYPNPRTPYSLVGCTVAPGFEFADFQMGRRDTLLAQYPAARQLILQLTSP